MASLALWTAAIVVLVLRWYWSSTKAKLSIRGDVLLVFAHPDDEAMFFTPLLHYLQSHSIGVHFLCLSNGNFDGKGSQRERELYNSGAFFGVPSRNIRVVDHPELQDGMGNAWSLGAIRHEIEVYLKRTGSISTIITFDEFGVSGHPNHVAVHDAVRLAKSSMPPGLIFLQLHTRSIITKYVGLASLLPYLTWRNPNHGRYSFAVLIPPQHVARSTAAMERHRSQLVWFRYLFVIFSSYTFVDELTELRSLHEGTR